jgi:hypothetical protein
MEPESSQRTELSVTSNTLKTKRKYNYSPSFIEQKSKLDSLEKLSFTKRELEKIGLIRPELKYQYAEASARFIHELNSRLRSNPSEFSNQELIVGAKQTADTTLELEKSSTPQEQLDWSKFSVEEFEKPNNSNDQNKS